MRFCRVALVCAVLAAAGCVKESPRTTIRPAPADDERFSTANEKSAREAVTRYFELLAAWNLPAAYDLLARNEQQKVSYEDYVKACEADRAGIIDMAGRARVTKTGEGGPMPETGKPYVMVVVAAEGEPDAIFGAVPEAGAWRVILTDVRRVVRTQ